MPNHRLTAILALMAIIGSGTLARRVAAQIPLQNGFWEWSLGTFGGEPYGGEYEEFIRIKGDSGFHCVLDGKSSYAFAIRNDSITTPMNGMNGIVLMPGSGDLVVSGYEKGVAYQDRYRHSDSAAYWSKCREEEDSWMPTMVRAPALSRRTDDRRAPVMRPLFAWKRKIFTVLGTARPD